MKNITLSAPEEMIEAARRQAVNSGTTLNEQFRLWLDSQTKTGQQKAQDYHELLKKLPHVESGRKFTRDEMNERL